MGIATRAWAILAPSNGAHRAWSRRRSRPSNSQGPGRAPGNDRKDNVRRRGVLVERADVCGVVKDDLMVRIGEAGYAEALRKPHVRPMDFTGRPLTGYIYVAASGCRGDFSRRGSNEVPSSCAPCRPRRARQTGRRPSKRASVPPIIESWTRREERDPASLSGSLPGRGVAKAVKPARAKASVRRKGPVAERGRSAEGAAERRVTARLTIAG